MGTNKKSAEQISKEFYKIASNFYINTSDEYTTVTISGLKENFAQAVKLYEELIANVKGDNEALTALKAKLQKARIDHKSDRGAIMTALTNYAMYGAKINSIVY